MSGKTVRKGKMSRLKIQKLCRVTGMGEKEKNKERTVAAPYVLEDGASWNSLFWLKSCIISDLAVTRAD